MVLIASIIYTILSFALFLLARVVYRQQIMQSETQGLLKELWAFRLDTLSLWKNKQKLFFFLALVLLLLNLPLWCFYIWGKTDANVLVVILSIVYFYYVLKYLFPPDFYDDENEEDIFTEESSLYEN